MSRTRITVWPVALVVAVILGGGSAWGNEVTVIGSAWRSRPIPEPNNADSFQASVPPSSNVSSVGLSVAEDVPTSESSEQEPRFEGQPGASDWTKDAPAPQFRGQGPRYQGQSGISDVTGKAPAIDFPGQELGCGKQPSWVWTIDYRFRSMCGSGTSYEFGTSTPPPTGYAPLSQLNFPINSAWHGLRAGLEEPTWDVHFEWMMPQQGIQGDFSDYDWNPPNPDGSYTDLGFAQERWLDGQMIDFGLDFQLTECLFHLPIEVWPTGGFRWQRFNIMAYNGVYVKENNLWINPPDLYPVDVLSFNQQYYIGYIGGQFRTKLSNVALMFQADWGYTWGYNIDHHLLRDGDRWTMENTHGNSWHLAFTAEVPLSEQISLGFQVDHTEIYTSGTHHLLNLPLGQDLTWDNGVSASSNQTWITAFLRFRT